MNDGNPASPDALDAVFDVLRAERRRRVLVALLDRESVTGFEGFGGDDDSGREREHATAMYHVHLPKLAAAGHVAWDRDRGTVARGPWFDEIRPVLELFDDNAGHLPTGWP